LDLTHTGSEHFLEEFYTILLEERLQVVLKVLQVGICSSLQSPKLTNAVQWCSNIENVLEKEHDVHFQALQLMTKQSQLCKSGNRCL
jgi:hypothetical protein